MVATECLWCETKVKSGTATCPECGLNSPASKAKTAARGGSGKVVRRGRRLVVTLVAMPMMLSAAYAAGVHGLPLVKTVAAGSAVASLQPVPPAGYSDQLQRSVWIDGVKAVQQAMGQSGYTNFNGSYVNVAAGHIVSFCGEVAGTSGYDSASGAQRFISVFGQPQATTLEGTDASFGVLWNRVCSPSVSAA